MRERERPTETFEKEDVEKREGGKEKERRKVAMEEVRVQMHVETLQP